MNKQLDNKMEQAWNFVFDKLYCKDTKLIYDYITDSGNTGSLPTPSEIEACCPNPCGWGTGMEDSVLNGGSFLEAIISRYNVTKEEKLLSQATDIYEGLRTCATVSEQRGFLARSVSPVDGKSHYINSSRDQYTHAIYALYLYWKSDMSTQKQKAEIQDILVSFAEKAERDVVKENDYFLLREDNKPALVCQMYDEDHRHVLRHEVHRLPMFYMGAYVVSGDKHWWDKYVEYRDGALDFAETFDDECIKIYDWCYALLQMQYSVRLLYEGETDASYKERYAKLLRKIASYMPVYTKKTRKIIDNIEYRDVVTNWRKCPAKFFWFVVSHGKSVYIPLTEVSDILQQTARNHTEAMVIYALAPDFEIPKEEIDFFEEFIQKVDFSKSVTYWPLLCADAWWVLRDKFQK